MTMTRSELIEMFRSTAAEVAEREFPELTEESEISSMGVDSLAMLEVIGEMERTLKIRLPDEELSGIVTVRQLIDVVHAKL